MRPSVTVGESIGQWTNERQDNISFNFTRPLDSPYAYLILNIEPMNVVDVYETSYKVYNDTIEEYTYSLRCLPMVSYRAKVNSFIRPH